jgi:NADPH:quinone reductase-like Zn-dependent oxidoreductase
MADHRAASPTLGAAQNVEVRRIFWKQVDVLGSTMGSPSDFAGMLRLYAEETAPLPPHRADAVETPLRPIVDSVVPLDRAAEAHRRMEDGQQFGKIVLKI